MKVTPWSWRWVEWTCPRCLFMLTTLLASPVCPRCRFREAGD